MDLDKVKEYIRLTAERRAHEDKAKELAGEIDALREELVGAFRDEGMQRATVDGYTAYLRRDVRAGANKDWKEATKEWLEKFEADHPTRAWLLEQLEQQEGGATEALADALKAAGLGDMVKESVNANTLSSWVREHDPDKVLGSAEIIARLPAVVRPCVSVYEQWDIGVTKA